MGRVSPAPIILFFLAFSVFARPGVQRQQGKDSGDIVRLDSRLVTVEAIATDRNGNYVTRLTRDDFNLYEDETRQKVEFFDVNTLKDSSRPISAVFALDISGSIEPEQLQQQQESARQFVSLVRKGSEFAVLTFNYDVKVVQNFTSDANRIAAAFRKAAEAEGSTRIYDAVDKAIGMLKKGPQYRDGRRLRRVIILITDGFDSSSTIAPEEVIRRAGNAEVTVYSITIPNYLPGLNGKRQRSLTLLDLAGVVPKTGGIDFSADDYDFTPIFKSITEDIKASYTLAFYPSEASLHDGKFHRIRVEANDPTVRLRVNREGFQSQK